MSTDLKEKPLIRSKVLSRRDSLISDIRDAKDKSIRNRLLALPEFITARTVLFYASFKSEVDTFDLLKKSILNKKTVVLPKVDLRTGGLELYAIRSTDDLAPGYFGIPEPPAIEGRHIKVSGIDLLIIPGVAFDLNCNRLGYGKGFYDKLLSQKTAPAVALAYEEQVMKDIPAYAHDIKMDKIITDKKIIQRDGQ